MARLGVRRPKRLTERYDSLAGDLNERRTLYLFRRRLGITPEEARRLPWWEWKMYVDGLLWEFADTEETEYVDGTADNLRDQGFTVAEYGG